jgi:hypothetical protein
MTYKEAKWITVDDVLVYTQSYMLCKVIRIVDESNNDERKAHKIKLTIQNNFYTKVVGIDEVHHPSDKEKETLKYCLK